MSQFTACNDLGYIRGGTIATPIKYGRSLGGRMAEKWGAEPDSLEKPRASPGFNPPCLYSRLQAETFEYTSLRADNLKEKLG